MTEVNMDKARLKTKELPRYNVIYENQTNNKQTNDRTETKYHTTNEPMGKRTNVSLKILKISVQNYQTVSTESSRRQ